MIASISSFLWALKSLQVMVDTSTVCANPDEAANAAVIKPVRGNRRAPRLIRGAFFSPPRLPPPKRKASRGRLPGAPRRRKPGTLFSGSCSLFPHPDDLATPQGDPPVHAARQ